MCVDRTRCASSVARPTGDEVTLGKADDHGAEIKSGKGMTVSLLRDEAVGGP